MVFWNIFDIYILYFYLASSANTFIMTIIDQTNASDGNIKQKNKTF